MREVALRVGAMVVALRVRATAMARASTTYPNLEMVALGGGGGLLEGVLVVDPARVDRRHVDA